MVVRVREENWVTPNAQGSNWGERIIISVFCLPIFHVCAYIHTFPLRTTIPFGYKVIWNRKGHRSVIQISNMGIRVCTGSIATVWRLRSDSRQSCGTGWSPKWDESILVFRSKCSKVSPGAPNYLGDEVLPISRLYLFLLFLQKLFAKTPLTAFEEQTSFLKENIET